MTRAILHIGIEKTGTSTLQKFLHKNREALDGLGVRYPVFPGQVNQTLLTAYAAEPERQARFLAGIGVFDAAEHAEFRAEFATRAAAEVAAYPDHLFVFSNEHLSSQLTSAAEIARLHGLLAPLFEEIAVAVYLRRQDRLAMSLYSTQVRLGADWPPRFPLPQTQPAFFDFARLLELWAGGFGDAALHPAIFDPATLANGSVIDDFCNRWAIAGPLTQVANENEALSHPAQDFLCRFNRAVGALDPEFNARARGEIGDILSKRFSGRGPRPARAEAEAFLARFAESNEACRAKWFPEREALFDPGFDDLPEREVASGLDLDRAMDMTADLVHALFAAKTEAEHRGLMRAGELAEHKGDAVAAERFYRRAAKLETERSEARSKLAALRGRKATAGASSL
ncbi:MAG: hypothetical protein ACFBRM_06550 [Pikeienuella sp.]